MTTTPTAPPQADEQKLTRLRLDSMPLPVPGEEDDKDGRGVVLVVGGSDNVPGAMVLAGEGALRAGAGKLQLATVRKAAVELGLLVPEALVVPLPTTRAGEIAGTSTGARLQPFVSGANAVLMGPGMTDGTHIGALLNYLIPHFQPTATLVLDGPAAIALRNEPELLMPLDGRVVITPHCGEMAKILDMEKDDVVANPARIAQQCAEQFGCVVVLKGGDTFIAHRARPLLHYRDGKVGLATSGSGDTLAGIIAGLAARGADGQTAAAWGVFAHGSAGNKLSRSVGPVGYLARELLREIPHLLT